MKKLASQRAQPLLTLVLLTAIASKAGAASLTIYTVNYPLQYFAQRIAGSHAEVVFPAPATVDPALWMPDPAVINAYQGADLILLNGAGYASWTDKVALPRSSLVDTSAGFKSQYLAAGTRTTHSHGPAGEHSHTGTAYTTWLDFALAARQAAEIRDAVARLRPDLSKAVQENYAALEKDLLALDQQAEAIGLHARGKPIVASHPVFQYPAAAYGLNVQSVHWEPDRPPGDEQWAELRSLMGRHQAEIMLWEGQPEPAVVQRLGELDIESVVFSPAANRPPHGDWLSVMRENLQRLEHAALR